MPTARMRDDGVLTPFLVQQDTLDTYGASYQLLPWLEASFRYAIFNPGDKIRSSDGLEDRSFEVKARLLEEKRYFPQVAIGLRDLFGTGVFAGEYVVASKRFGALDVTGGFGWGRFSDRATLRNPLRLLSNSFRTRKGFDRGDQGQPIDGTFFRGEDVGFFGGVEYRFDRFGVDLLAEYSSDAFERSERKGTIDEASPFNYGIRWRPQPGLALTLSHQLGQDVVLGLSASIDTKALPPVKRARGIWKSEVERSAAEDAITTQSWYERLLFDIERSGLLLLGADVQQRNSVVWLEIENIDYALAADAVRTALELAEIHLPSNVHTINVLINRDGIANGAVSYRRRPREVSAQAVRIDDSAIVDVISPRLLGPSPRHLTRFRKPNFNTTLELSSRFQVMDPDDPLRYQIFGRVGVAGDLGADFYLRAAIAVDLYNDFGDISRTSNSVLPRVRSDVARYLQEGDTGIASLYLERRGMIADDVSYRTYAGILEDMYSGVGGEILWQPFPSRFAFGLSATWVTQRDFDRDFGHQKFETTVGHASVYWDSPIADYDVAVHMGRYLARDKGATFELRRTLDNGWMIGAWATFTDVSFEDFGEGSFDKGLFFRIPFNSMLPGNTRGAYATALRLLQRDGGQRLEDFGTTLWWDSRDTRTDALVRTRSRMVPR